MVVAALRSAVDTVRTNGVGPDDTLGPTLFLTFEVHENDSPQVGIGEVGADQGFEHDPHVFEIGPCEARPVKASAADGDTPTGLVATEVGGGEVRRSIGV